MNFCPLCNGPTTIYWLHDNVWTQVLASNPNAKELTCIHCAELAIQRLLTLRDLSVENFARTAANNVSQPGLIRDYVRSFIVGACKASNNIDYWPKNWQYSTNPLNKKGEDIGGQLARQTADICSILDQLIQEADRFDG